MNFQIIFGLLAIITCSAGFADVGTSAFELKGRKLDRFYFNGNLDLRVQNEADDGADNRLNQRMAVRLSAATEFDSWSSGQIEVATGSSSRSPRQTLGDQKNPGFARRTFGLQRAFIDYHPEPWISLKVGRIPQSHETVGDSGNLLDGSVALEGALVETAIGLGSGKLKIAGGSHWIRENYDFFYSEDVSDIMLNWGQVSYHLDFLSVGAGFFNFASIQGAAFTDLNIDASAAGNSQDPAGTVKNRFLPKQAFAEYRWNLGPGELKFFVETLINDETVDPNKAVWTGFGWKASQFSSLVAYGEIDSDAVPSFTTDSSFADGNTDSKGFMINLAWKFSKNFRIEFTQYLNRLKKSTTDDQYLISQLDARFSL